MAKELYVQFTAQIAVDLKVPVESGDPTSNEDLARAAVENEYPEATDIEIINVVEEEVKK